MLVHTHTRHKKCLFTTCFARLDRFGCGNLCNDLESRARERPKTSHGKCVYVRALRARSSNANVPQHTQHIYTKHTLLRDEKKKPTKKVRKWLSKYINQVIYDSYLSWRGVAVVGAVVCVCAPFIRGELNHRIIYERKHRWCIDGFVRGAQANSFQIVLALLICSGFGLEYLTETIIH